MNNKGETYPRMKQFLRNIYNQYNTIVQTIRSDNGQEFLSKEFQHMIKKLGINHQLTCVHTPQQNRIVERKHKHLLEMARALMSQFGLPLKY